MKGFVRKPKGIIVFVKNKLISLDSIAPVLLELKEKNNISSTVVVFDQMAHEGIKTNVVLRDLINFTGRELFVSRGINNIVFRKPIILVTLLGVFFKFIIGYKIIHFGTLNSWPLKYLFFFYRKNIFFAQQDSFRHTWGKVHIKLGLKYKTKNVFFFGETRTRKIWLDYCTQNSHYYLNKYHSGIDFSRGCAVFILSTFEELNEINPRNSMLNLFYETITVLSSLNIPVLLKPHVFTDLDIVEKAIKDNKNFHITSIHPTILALNSNFFIANVYSTTFADAKSLGISTIEYTDYSKELLRATNEKSYGYEYVEYFINNNKALLAEKINDVLLRTQRISKVGNKDDNSGLLKKLSE